MKNKFIKSIATLLLAFTLLSNWAIEAGNALMPGASTCGAGCVIEEDDGDFDEEYYGFLPYHK